MWQLFIPHSTFVPLFSLLNTHTPNTLVVRPLHLLSLLWLYGCFHSLILLLPIFHRFSSFSQMFFSKLENNLCITIFPFCFFIAVLTAILLYLVVLDLIVDTFRLVTIFMCQKHRSLTSSLLNEYFWFHYKPVQGTLFCSDFTLSSSYVSLYIFCLLTEKFKVTT